jgi:hypothetical protein
VGRQRIGETVLTWGGYAAGRYGRLARYSEATRSRSNVAFITEVLTFRIKGALRRPVHLLLRGHPPVDCKLSF